MRNLVHNTVLRQAVDNELILVTRLRAEDEAAMKQLYKMYNVAFRGAISRILPDHLSIVEDLVQITFMKIWDSIELEDRRKGRLFTWMITIAQNLALDEIRSKAFRKFKKTELLKNFIPQIDRLRFTQLI